MAEGLRDGRVLVEDHGWPLLLLRVPAALSVEAVRSFVDAIEGAYLRNERFAVVIDTTAVSKFPAAPARQILSDWVGNPRRAEREHALTVGTALVIASSPLRALTAAVNLARRKATPQQWTATLVEAVEWARNRLVAENVPLTPGAEALYAEVTASRALRMRRGA
jgi:hypothetical protein